MTIYQSFQAGGWPMYFVLAFGISAVYGAVRFFWHGHAALERFSRTMIQTTVFSSVFGFLVGMIAVAGYVEEHTKTLDERVKLLIEGTGESLNSLTLGLLLTTLSCLLIAVGQRRFPSEA